MPQLKYQIQLSFIKNSLKNLVILFRNFQSSNLLTSQVLKTCEVFKVSGL